MDLLTYDELRDMERRERAADSFTEVTEEFIQRFHAYVADKQRLMSKSDDNLIAAKVKEQTSKELFNARNSYKNIFEYRSRKIFNQAIIDLRMNAQPVIKDLLPFEQELYKTIRESLNKHFNKINKGKLKKVIKTTQHTEDKNTLVRFVKDMPEFVWKESTLGPFKKEDVANLPTEVTKLLSNKGVIKKMLGDEE